MPLVCLLCFLLDVDAVEKEVSERRFPAAGLGAAGIAILVRENFGGGAGVDFERLGEQEQAPEQIHEHPLVDATRRKGATLRR